MFIHVLNMYAEKPRLNGLALAFRQSRPGQTHRHGEAVITAWLGLAYFGWAWLGSRFQGWNSTECDIWIVILVGQASKKMDNVL